MRILRIGAAALNQTPLDWEGNRLRILAAIREAKEQGVSLLCLPELCLTGYGCEDAFHAQGVAKKALRMLQSLSREARDITFCVGLPVLYKNALFNCVALLGEQRVLGLVPKQHLAGDGIHYEPRWFKPWRAGVSDWFDLPSGDSVPIGDLQFNLDGIRVGFEICEDAWVANRPGVAMASEGVDIILNPSASHFAFGKLETRKRFVIEGSRAYGCTYVYANLLGNEAGRVIFDGGVLIASGGKLVAAGPRFSFSDVDLITTTVDIDATRTLQVRSASYTPNLSGTSVRMVATDVELPTCAVHDPIVIEDASWERHEAPLKFEEFTRAVSLALFDYMRKSRSQGFVISLSGGADSAACAVLVYTMVQLAAKHFSPMDPQAGLIEVARRLYGRNDVSPPKSAKNLVGKLLTCAYQPTENSGEVTSNAAREIAEAIGAKFHVVNVDAISKLYIAEIEEALGRKLSWETDDLALQNIQARVRAPSIWMLANIENKLLLATSNRSEAAVGYCTMDGDTAGSISPIAGIDKAFLRNWLEWMECPHNEYEEPPFVGVPELKVVNRQVPTAELRPQSASQTDEKDLMPYPVLDAIERAAIRDKKMPVEVYQTLLPMFPKVGRAELCGWIERFFHLWTHNQWKREKLPLSFHLDDENLDPRSWCRFPILSSGLTYELNELRNHVKKETL